MADLFDELLAFLGQDRSVEQVAKGHGLATTETARLGAVLSAPVILAGFERWARGPVGAAWLTARIPSVRLDGEQGLSGHDESGDVQMAGDAVLSLILEDRRKEVAETVGTKAGLDASVIDELMCVTAWGVVVCLARRFKHQPNRDEIVSALAAARVSLLNAGWGDWIITTSGDDAVEPLVTPVSAGVAAPTSAPATYPPPIAGPLRSSPPVEGAQPQAGAGHVARAPQPSPGLPPANDPTGERSSGGSPLDRSARLQLAILGAVVVGLLLLFLLAFWSRGGGDETVASDLVTTTPSGADGSGTAIESGTADDAGATDEEATTGGGEASGGEQTDQSSSAAPSTEAVRLESFMADPLERTAGTADSVVTLDPATGEVCFDLTVTGLAEPYDGHIHVGPAGVKGGIIVDFGALTGSPSGCLQSTPTDVNSILSDLAGHYVELHDAGGVATIRSQLAEGTGVPAESEETGGAYAMIEAGALRLVGDVPDQVTADKYIESFADVDLGSTELVNEMRIVEGAPRPSGRIVVDNQILFETDSDQIGNPDSTVLADLATLFVARPAWRLTVVGHTDSTGADVYNLELSLRRAEAVRTALVAAGVSADMLTITGAGSTNPIAPNDTPEGRASNRRIELVVIPA